MNFFRRARIRVGLVLALGVGMATGGLRTGRAQEPAPEATQEEPAAPQTASASQAPPGGQASSGTDCAAELAKLKQEHERLLINYKNALAQAKALLVYKKQVRDIDDVRRQGRLQARKLERDREDALEEIKELHIRIAGLNADVARLRQQRDEYKKNFEKASVENIIGEDAQKKIDALEDEKALLEKRTAVLERRIKTLEHEGVKKEAEAELYRRRVDEIKKKYAEAVKNNRVLEKKIRRAPKRAAELARENKILIKRTALMHYNLGVFYTQNREFARAVKEFEKAVELNPHDAASFFNLGYIYAEHLQNRSKAVEHFRQYLKVAQKDDKDADWVKRYILTWQTWEGNVPIK